MSRQTDITAEELNARVSDAISFLENDPSEAIKLLYPYIPSNGSIEIDYGIYSLQYILAFGETTRNNSDVNTNLPLKVNEIFEKCKTNNKDEYLKLIEWVKKWSKPVASQMKRAKVNIMTGLALSEALTLLSPINPTTVNKLISSLQVSNPQYHLLGNAYKDEFEINFFIELIGNLINISEGNSFSQKPFKGVQINCKSIVDKKGNIIKANAIEWIEKNSDTFFGEIIRSSYNSKLRNLVGGHNSYELVKTFIQASMVN
jgi:hypothetical protein